MDSGTGVLQLSLHRQITLWYFFDNELQAFSWLQENSGYRICAVILAQGDACRCIASINPLSYTGWNVTSLARQAKNTHCVGDLCRSFTPQCLSSVSIKDRLRMIPKFHFKYQGPNTVFIYTSVNVNTLVLDNFRISAGKQACLRMEPLLPAIQRRLF